MDRCPPSRPGSALAVEKKKKKQQAGEGGRRDVMV
jgi:hypothetical protein